MSAGLPDAGAFVPAALVEVLADALRRELEDLEAVVRRTEDEAAEVEQRASTLGQNGQIEILRVQRYLADRRDDVRARHEALLAECQVEADRRLVNARDEAELILLDGTGLDLAALEREDPTREHDAAASDGGPMVAEVTEVIAVLEAVGAVPEPSNTPEQVTPQPDAHDPVDDAPDADERFQQFWAPAGEAERSWAPQTNSVPLAAIAAVVAVLAAIASLLLVVL